MTDQKPTFMQIIKKFDNFEEEFIDDPGNKSLLEFFETLKQVIDENAYATEQLQIIRNRMVKLKGLFSETKNSLSKKSNDALKRHKSISQYIKTSHIKK